ncbi:MAG: YggS family pyridoxal phosphate-dependent enzyme [Oscillospiraceae bacterium]|nr:YggS family pyridoxal phosphate-dependent enzyme [Oscillospiraceae bacterium]
MDTIYNYIAENLKTVRGRIETACAAAGRDPSEVLLMAVSKTQPEEKLAAAVAEGQTLFGENRVQELMQKNSFFRKHGADCHIIGTLQTNKVKYLPDMTGFIQSVDSLKLAREISKQYSKAGRTADILIELNIGDEDSKSGADPDQAEELACAVSELDSVRLRGFMCIPPICEGDLVRRYFSKMYRIYSDIASKKIPGADISVLSMGMSDDFEYAVLEGSTLVRVGRGIFGERIYNTAQG